MNDNPPGQGAMSPRVMLIFAVLVLIWGSTWTAIRYQLGVEAPGWSIAWRFVFASLAMGLYARMAGVSLRLAPRDLPLLLGVAMTQFVLNFLFVYNAERFITSGLVAMIFALLIVPNAVLGRLFLKQRVGGAFFVGTVVAGLGMALLFRHEIMEAAGGGSTVLLGIGLSLFGTLSASVGNLLQASQRASHLHAAQLLFWAMAIGAVANMVIALPMSGLPRIDPRPEYWLATLWLAFIGSALTFPLYLYVMRAIGPARAAYSSVLIPIVAMLFSTLLEGYRWTGTAVAGALLAGVGLVIALRGKSGAQAPSASKAASPAR